MLFNTSEFIFLFLPLAVALHFLVARWSVTAAVLVTTLSSLLFYAYWNPPFVLLPMLSIGLNFLLARSITAAAEPTARRLMAIQLSFFWGAPPGGGEAMSSARERPITSPRLRPNSRSAAGLNSTIRPS